MNIKFLVIGCIFSIVNVFSQIDYYSIQNEMLKKSRAKSEMIFQQLDATQQAKILFSIENKYFYVMIKNKTVIDEYFAVNGDSSKIYRIRKINYHTDPLIRRRQKRHLQNLLNKAQPIFDCGKYHDKPITEILDATEISGRISYFVLIDEQGKRCGEYSLNSLTTPLPISSELYAFLVTRISSEISKQAMKIRTNE